MWFEGFLIYILKWIELCFWTKSQFSLCFILMSIKFDSHKKYLTAVGIQTISLKNTRFLQRSYCESQILTSFSPFHVHTEKLAHCTDCREGLDVLPFKYQTQWCLGGLSVLLLLSFFSITQWRHRLKKLQLNHNPLSKRLVCVKLKPQ